jgi:uncharacterized protein YbcC (UPF0753/DUF2309 family)
MSKAQGNPPSGLKALGRDAEASATTPEVTAASGDDALRPGGPGLGKRLKIRSMVAMAGEVLPFFWPMRNFIHHNPLHGLEHLPFEEAVDEAAHLFHARGYLCRADYQRLMGRGSIDPEILETLVIELVQDWLTEHGAQEDAALADLLQRCLMVLLQQMDQPAPGVDIPCAEEVLKALKRNSERPGRGDSGP